MAYNITTIHFSKSVPVIQLVMVVCGLTMHICNILVSGILLYVQVTRDCNSISKSDLYICNVKLKVDQTKTHD